MKENKLKISHILITLAILAATEGVLCLSSYAFALAMIAVAVFWIVYLIFYVKQVVSFCIKSKRVTKTRGDKITFIIVTVLILSLFARNILLSESENTTDGENSYIEFKENDYNSYQIFETDWYPTGIGTLSGKAVYNYESFLSEMFALNRIYAVKGDNDHISYLARDTLSEFGDYVYYRSDIELPTLENISPYEIRIGHYNTVQTWDILKNKTFYSSDDADAIEEIMQILRHETTTSYELTDDEKDILSELDEKYYIELGFLSDQVPGSVYILNISEEEGRYYITYGDETIDVTYVLAMLMG